MLLHGMTGLVILHLCDTTILAGC